MAFIPKGNVLMLRLIPPVRTQVDESTALCRFAMAIWLALEKTVIVPVAGFPQLVPARVANSWNVPPIPIVAGKAPRESVVGAGVTVRLVDAAGPAVKLASPL